MERRVGLAREVRVYGFFEADYLGRKSRGLQQLWLLLLDHERVVQRDHLVLGLLDGLSLAGVLPVGLAQQNVHGLYQRGRPRVLVALGLVVQGYARHVRSRIPQLSRDDL